MTHEESDIIGEKKEGGEGMVPSMRNEEDMRNKLHKTEARIAEKQMEIQAQRRELEVMKEDNLGKARMVEITEEMKALLTQGGDILPDDGENDIANPINLVNALKAKDSQVSRLLEVLADQSSRIEQASTIFADLGVQISSSDEKLVNQKARMEKQKQALVELVDLVTEQSREIENFKQAHHPEVANETNNLVDHASWLACGEENSSQGDQKRGSDNRRDKELDDKPTSWKNTQIPNTQANTHTSRNTQSSDNKHIKLSGSKGSGYRDSNCGSSRDNCFSQGRSAASKVVYEPLTDAGELAKDNLAPHCQQAQQQQQHHHHHPPTVPPTHYIIKNNIMCAVM